MRFLVDGSLRRSEEMVVFPDAPERFRDRPARFSEATDLMVVGLDHHGREARLSAAAAAAWNAMRHAAEADGAHLLLISGFRSIEYQAGIVRQKRERGQSWDQILRVSAYPGFSEHHTGCAVDLASPDCPHLEEAFEETPEFAWLAQNASRFGFVLSYPRGNAMGVAYEPWHWCWHEG